MANAVMWFRKGLRIHDNPALVHAAKLASPHLYCVFVLDPWFVKSGKVGPNRFHFLLESLENLDTNLRKLGSRLIVLRGKPEEVFRSVFPQWGVKSLCFESDIEPYAKQRDSLVAQMADELKIDVFTSVSHTLYDPDAIISKAPGGKAPTTYAQFQKAMKLLGKPQKPLACPAHLPSFDDNTQLKCITSFPDCVFEKTGGVPSMKAIGYDKPDNENLTPFRGGEAAALTRMEHFLAQTKRVLTFEKPKTLPCALEPETTVLSPYLKFGCLSVRTLFWEIDNVISGKKHTEPPVSLIGQVLWREFYYTIAHDTPNYDKMQGNPICRQIPWESDPDVDYNERLNRWKNAETGYPWIDAAMTQLRQQGWIHHLARHAVACFLTRGDLWVNWEKGADVFDYYLIDADWALNNGNWMWLSASAFFHQFGRVYSPISFQMKNDPEGTYIKKFLPKLKKVPKKFIYSPWKMSKAEQKLAGVIIGEDYPSPIVDHETAKQYNLNLMAKAYKEAREKKAGSSGNKAYTKAGGKGKKATGTDKAGKRKPAQGAMDKFVSKKSKK